MIIPLVHILVVVLIFAVILWAVSLIPLQEPFRQIVYVILALILILWLLSFLGLLGVGGMVRLTP